MGSNVKFGWTQFRLELHNVELDTSINIEEEKVTKNGQFLNYPGSNPPMTINLYLMFSAYFSNFNYTESLLYISLVIEFFQNHNFFNKLNTPLLSSNIDKLYVEFF